MPLPLLLFSLIALLKGDLFKALTGGVLFFGFMLTAMVARHGFKTEFDLKNRRVINIRVTPFKSISALLLGICTGLTAFFLVSYGILSSIFLGFVASMGFILTYGKDPSKTSRSSLGNHAEEVLVALDNAEIKINNIEHACRKIKNIEFNQQLKKIIKKAREILDVIEDDPKDLSRARKFLTVYLDGTQRVTESYAKTHYNKATNSTLDGNFQEVLTSIKETFNEQHQKLLKNDQFDLDVKIEVLKTQLEREGVV